MASVLLLLALYTALGVMPSIALAQSDSVIVQMQEAYRAKRQSTLSVLLPEAQGHILEPWAAYWELSNRLKSATDDEIQDFSRRYAGTYQEDRLRNDWLLLLGQRREWQTFNRHIHVFRMNDDRSVRCYAAAAKGFPNGQAKVVLGEWMALKAESDACSYAVEGYYRNHALNAQDVWRVARVASEANRRAGMEQAVQIVAPAQAAQVFRLVSNPTLFLSQGQQETQSSGIVASAFQSASELADRLAAQLSGQSSSPAAPSAALAVDDAAIWRTAEDKEMAALALIRVAASASSTAANLMQSRFDRVLGGETRSWVWAVIGKESALDLSPLASSYFDNAKNEDLSDDLLGWKVRAALRSGRWSVVESAISAMSASAQSEAIWMYWRGRALAATGSDSAARTWFQKLTDGKSTYAGRPAGIEDFYVQLATEELGKKIQAPKPPRGISSAERQEAERNMGLQRALYAMQMGLRSEGNREWNYQTNLHKPGGKEDRERLAAAALACEREVWDRCINTSERSKEEFDATQRYPMPLKNEVVYHSTNAGLDPAYVYGLIRQESRFVTAARSGVGASGLMQVMRDTARIVARRIGLTNYTDRMINDKDVNLQLGTSYLKMALDDFEGSKPMALAAYNAGPGRPRRWREAMTTPAKLEAAIWAETIPFSETRDYVKKVLSNNVMYAAQLTGRGQSLKAELGAPIGPRPYSLPAVDASLP